jgi:nucleoside triphosphate diphosphatase
MSKSPIERLLEIMRRLRDPATGCAWDREQSFATLAPFAIEEAYEVADAAQSGDFARLREELGDLLFQVVFHAQVAAESGQFRFDDVAGAICDKLIRRHPHVFDKQAALNSAEQALAWDAHKAAERRATAHAPSQLDGIAAAMPALLRATKISKRAAQVGFDWPHAGETAAKVEEELREVREAMAGHANDAAIKEEIGDLLFASANLARKLGIDAEEALRAANAKFERRFRRMEAIARDRGLDFSSLDLVQQEALWSEAKTQERAANR